jgi:hypothetical protein
MSVIKPRRKRLFGNVAYMRYKKAYKISTRNLELKRPLGRLGQR